MRHNIFRQVSELKFIKDRLAWNISRAVPLEPSYEETFARGWRMGDKAARESAMVYYINVRM